MGVETKIQWTDHTFNPWRGCTKVSPGCANCYAEAQSRRNPRVLGEWGPKGRRAIAAESYWRLPLQWDREAKEAGERRRVFCASLADVFEDRPELTLPRCRLLSLIHRTPNLEWLLLTKRPDGIMDRLHECSTQEDVDHGDGGRLAINDGACLAYQWKHGSPMPNVWLGTSVEDQQRADERIPALLEIPAAVRFLSVEPILGDIRFPAIRGIDWVIVGGESGPHARPCDVRWIRSIRDQCQDAVVACFVKQLGAVVIDSGGGDGTFADLWPDGTQSTFFREDGSYKVWLRDSHGGAPDEWPEDLRIREFPR